MNFKGYYNIVTLILIMGWLLIGCTYFKRPPTVDCTPRPFTSNERRFIDSLSPYYDSVQVERYDNQPCDAYGNGDYQIDFKYVSIEHLAKQDSMRRIAMVLATELYVKVMENSILYETPTIEIRFIAEEDKSRFVGNTQLVKSGSKSYFVFRKEDLETYCGFKVKKVRKDQFERIPVKEKSDTLKIFDESFMK